MDVPQMDRPTITPNLSNEELAKGYGEQVMQLIVWQRYAVQMEKYADHLEERLNAVREPLEERSFDDVQPVVHATDGVKEETR